MTPAQMPELKNFIEARNKAYALWVHKTLTRQIGGGQGVHPE